MSSNDRDLSAPPEASASLRPFFRPSSVVVIGASREPRGLGARLLDAVPKGGFRGRASPANPRAAEVAGPRASPSARGLPEAVDLALVAVPRDAVPAVVGDCAANGVRALVIITAGFAESEPPRPGDRARRLDHS